MSQDKAADAPDTAPEAETPPQETAAPKHNLASRLFSSFWQKVLAASFLIWATVIFLTLWFSGVIDNLRPETSGVVHIESPQIYTRERLVNDRFREQAWLETQLAELEDRAQVISSFRKDSFRLAASAAPTGKTAPEAADGAEPATQDQLEEELLVSADDSFNLQRNMRATIRRALIENELDDRHDLGSNSLYQFNFGAAIIAGSRTRRIAGIEMEIEPVDPLQPLDALIDDDTARCNAMFEFECAYLFAIGVLSKPDAVERTYVDQYARWAELFAKWLGSENATYKREADDIRELLRSPQASARVRARMQPFFDNLNRQATRFIENFAKVSDEAEEFKPARCRFERDGVNRSIEIEIEDFVQNCVEETNRVLRKIGDDVSGVTFYFDNFISDGREQDHPPEEIWRQFFTYVFNQFNRQCDWSEGFVEVEGNGPSDTAQNAAQPGTYYRLSSEVEIDLLDCIARSVIRDFGSHPFGQVERDETYSRDQLASEITKRTARSSYQAKYGLTDIVVTDKKNDFRSRDRKVYVGVASRMSRNTGLNGLDEYPFGIDRLNETCRHHKGAIAPPADGDHVLLAGISSSYLFERLAPPVDKEIGWNLLAHLICATYEPEVAGPDDSFLVDSHHTIPIGLFRFIGLLSGSQRTFSYSVQPSGAFNLQRRDQSTDWSLASLLTGTRQSSQIAAGGDTTESWIEKQYRIIGFGAQVEASGDADTMPLAQHKASFGWYVFPAAVRGGIFSRAVMESANIKLSALVSLPSWWESVDIKVKTSWRDPDAPERIAPFRDGGKGESEQELRVELPTRFEFIRNHFPHTAAIRPSLYELHLPKVSLRACEEARIVLKGERLWRSTVVTLGSQRSTLIQVMPDMRGIIAHFGAVVPFDVEDTTTNGTPGVSTVPVTIWTSEGQKSVVDTVSIKVPASVRERMDAGEPPCPASEGQSDK